jgi:signal transduction histidine kinase
MPFESVSRWRGLTVVIAIVACVLVSLLAWTGYVAVREWQRSVAMRAEQEAEAVSGLLLNGLTRDMRAVQRSVLLSPAVNAVTLRPPYEAFNTVAGAFARYQYPESFFLWRRDSSSQAGVLLYRRERQPHWAKPADDPHRFPLTLENDAPVMHALLDRIRVDAAQARRFSVFETTLEGNRYQVVARLFYNGIQHQELDAAFGFTVNLDWVRRHYFTSLLGEALWTRGAGADVLLVIRDDQRQLVADTGRQPARDAISQHERVFPLMFFNPQLVAADPPSDLQRRFWVIQAAVRDNSSLMSALDAANRMLVLQVIAVGALAVGVLLAMGASRAKTKLAHLQSEFISSVTHEFKTPIATIKAAGESLAAGRIDGSAARQEYAAYIVQEARRLARLVDNLLTFSRVTDATVAKHHFEPVALANVVSDTLQRFALQIGERKFTVRVDVPDSLPLIAGDPSAIELMLDNLIDNAIRHSRNAQQLEIRATARYQHIVLEVADLGGGIAEEELAHVTRKFYRGRHAGQGGTGLGLAIAQRIITEHGGTLAIRSEPGRGTTVVVTLPVSSNDKVANVSSVAFPTT